MNPARHIPGCVWPGDDVPKGPVVSNMLEELGDGVSQLNLMS